LTLRLRDVTRQTPATTGLGGFFTLIGLCFLFFSLYSLRAIDLRLLT